VALLLAVGAVLAGCKSAGGGLPTEQTNPVTTQTVTPTATSTPENRQPVDQADQKRFEDIHSSLVESTNQAITKIQNVAETTLTTLSKNLSETISGMKANTAGWDQRFRDFKGELTNLSKQWTSFATDPERAKMQIALAERQAAMLERMHAAELGRQERAHKREVNTHEKYTLMVTLILVAMVCLGLADNMHGWGKLGLIVAGLVLLVGSGAAYFFYNSIARV